MDNILPELLLHIFELVVHTSHEPNPSFPPRVLVRSGSQADSSNDTPQDYRAYRDDQYPHFPSGVTSHETNPHTPLGLSHVCKQWRAMASAESSLWATIYVTNGKERFQELFKLWLERSGSRPLKLVFRDGPRYTPGEGKTIVAMLDLAAAHSRRWRSFKIRLRYIQLPTQPLEASLKGIDTSNLRELAFSFNGTAYGTFMERWAGLMRSPKLREIQMWHTMHHDNTFLSSIPFPRLVVVTLPRVSIGRDDAFVLNLSQCANLRTLSVSLDSCLDPPTLYAVSIPTLRNLDVVGFSQSSTDAFLRLFHLPSLQHLSIRTQSLSSSPGGLALSSALEHWKPKLRSFELRTEKGSCDQPTFTCLLTHPALSTLRYLGIGGIGPRAADVLHLLTVSEGRSLLPQLQHIYIDSLHLNGDYETPAQMALSWSKLKEPGPTAEQMLVGSQQHVLLNPNNTSCRSRHHFP